MVMRALICLCCMTVAGCARVSVGTPWGLPEAPPDKEGLVFGSMVEGPYSYNSLKYRAKGADSSASISVTKELFRINDFSYGLGRGGGVFAVHLPPGQYELHNVSFKGGVSVIASAYPRAKTDFSIPFTVEEGTATYLGEFTPVWGYSFLISDELERDYSFLAKKGFVIPRERVKAAGVHSVVIMCEQIAKHWGDDSLNCTTPRSLAKP
jgi:hypothetical protein